jgi:hypothetical protein
MQMDRWMDRRTGETDTKMIIVTLHNSVKTPTDTKMIRVTLHNFVKMPTDTKT